MVIVGYNVSKLNAYKVNTGGKKIIEARERTESEQRANKRTVRRFSKELAKRNKQRTSNGN